MDNNKKYQAITIIGFLLIIFIVVLRNVMPLKLNFFLIGTVFGWFGSIFLFHSLSEKNKKNPKKKRRRNYDDFEKLMSSEEFKNSRY